MRYLLPSGGFRAMLLQEAPQIKCVRAKQAHGFTGKSTFMNGDHLHHQPKSSAAMDSPIDAPENVVEKAVPLPQPLWAQLRSSLAFALSALLSPYLVIPVGTVVIVASQSSKPSQYGPPREFLLWTAISILFSTGIPALYVIAQILRGKITDVHVMEREQRGGPFFVAVASSALGALILRSIGAPAVVWGIGLVLMVNGIILSWITTFWKISMHVAVLSACVLSVLILVPGINVWTLLWMVPALMWARSTRGRHSIWQGIAGCTVACAITGGAFASIRLWGLVESAVRRILQL